MSRFGSDSLDAIDNNIEEVTPANTVKSKNFVWNQFTAFCREKNYTLDAITSDETLADILKVKIFLLIFR